MTQPRTIRLHFVTDHDRETGHKIAEARADDALTSETVAQLPFRDMAEWLRSGGFRYVTGSNAVWSKAA